VHVIMDEIFMNGILVESNRKRAVTQMTWSLTSHWKSIKAPLLWNTWYDVHLRRFTLFPKEINPISCAKRKTTASPALIFRIKKNLNQIKTTPFLSQVNRMISHCCWSWYYSYKRNNFYPFHCLKERDRECMASKKPNSWTVPSVEKLALIDPTWLWVHMTQSVFVHRNYGGAL
jgi:hypothetical protein